ncbi:MerR family DNA-binding transcriptional regulator, partial [Pseudomonas amygdali]
MSGIGALSKSTGCHIETIRYYEKIGLLPPALRSTGRHRIYTEKHRSRLVEPPRVSRRPFCLSHATWADS